MLKNNNKISKCNSRRHEKKKKKTDPFLHFYSRCSILQPHSSSINYSTARHVHNDKQTVHPPLRQVCKTSIKRHLANGIPATTIVKTPARRLPSSKWHNHTTTPTFRFRTPAEFVRISSRFYLPPSHSRCMKDAPLVQFIRRRINIYAREIQRGWGRRGHARRQYFPRGANRNLMQFVRAGRVRFFHHCLLLSSSSSSSSFLALPERAKFAPFPFQFATQQGKRKKEKLRRIKTRLPWNVMNSGFETIRRPQASFQPADRAAFFIVPECGGCFWWAGGLAPGIINSRCSFEVKHAIREFNCSSKLPRCLLFFFLIFLKISFKDFSQVNFFIFNRF